VSTPQPAGSGEARLRRLRERLPAEMVAPVFTHSSWTVRRSDSYERLAFLGDSVLALAITAHLYPRLEADRFGAGRLTKIRAQTVSGRSCRAVAERLGVPDRLRTAAPAAAAPTVEALIATERVLASVIEAVIGACYLAFGYELTAAAVVDAFAPEVQHALQNPVDYKSALQEQLARRGALVCYSVLDEQGPPHDRTFQVSASIEGVEVGRGIGRSKKDAKIAADLAEAAVATITDAEAVGRDLGKAGVVALAAGAVVYNVIADIEKATGRELPSLPVAASSHSPSGEHSLAYRLLNGKSTRQGEPADTHAEDECEEVEPDECQEADQAEPSSELDPLFQTKCAEENNGITRLTVEQIVKNTVPNSYKVRIGRSLTDPEHKAVQITFFK